MDITIETFSPGLLIWQALMILAIILPIFALIDVLNNDFKKDKLFWIFMILFTNLIGTLLYYKFGTKQKISRFTS